MTTEFRQIVWDDSTEENLRRLLRLAVEEDLGEGGDCTSLAVVPEDVLGHALRSEGREPLEAE